MLADEIASTDFHCAIVTNTCRASDDYESAAREPKERGRLELFHL